MMGICSVIGAMAAQLWSGQTTRQKLKWPAHRPKTWPTEPTSQAQWLDLLIELLMLPTYASWTNPIEKLWRKLKQEELHLHRFQDEWSGLR